MTLLGLLVVLSLMTFLSQSVLLMETGYNYNYTTRDVTITGQYKDLKCTYLFIALTHMRLTKFLLEDENVSTRTPVGMINNFEIKAMICSLHVFGDHIIGSLWILYLYKCISSDYHHYRILTSQGRQKKTLVENLLGNHNYVIDKLQEESADCRKGNRFDSYGNYHAFVVGNMPNGKPEFYIIKQAVMGINSELDGLLTANRAQLTDDKWFGGFRVKNLFMNNLGSSVEVRQYLMVTYNVQVNWHGTDTALENTWKNAHEMDWNTNRFWKSSIKKYYDAHFDFLKTIVFRLLWTNLLCVKDHAGDSRDTYLLELYELLANFEKMLCLQGDPHVAYVLEAIHNLAQANAIESIVNIIYELESILHSIAGHLDCNATHPMTLVGLEHSQPYSQNHIRRPCLQKSISKPNNLSALCDFLAYLNSAFEGVNFDVIRSLMSYLNV